MTEPLQSYLAARDRFLNDSLICEANRQLFRRFFEYQEYKLKRRNRLAQLDGGCARTLLAYLARFRNVNKWFGNKPLAEITQTDIQRVYDGLEDGTIVSARGGRFKDRNDYYKKVFKSKLFAMVGKCDLAKQVIQFSTPQEFVVRFVLEPAVRKIYSYAYEREHRLLLWLGFDFGENINTLLNLVTTDFARQETPGSLEPEYRLQFRREILKRSRTARSEITLYHETVRLLDEHLATLQPGERLFSFGYRAAAKFLERASADAGVKCEPIGQSVTWKDLRSGMACDLLRKGWSRDEINARLGHKPSSTEIDKYINFFALDRHAPKAKVHQFEVSKLHAQVEQGEQRNKLTTQRLHTVEDEVAFLRARIRDITKLLDRAPDLAVVKRALAVKEEDAVAN